MPGFGSQGPQESNVGKYTEMPAPMQSPSLLPSAQLMPYAQIGNSLMGMLGENPSLLGGFTPFLPEKVEPAANTGAPLATPASAPSLMPDRSVAQRMRERQMFGGRR